MKVLVTGGAGFIGSHVVDLLCKDGHSVHVVDNLSSGSKDNVNASATFHLLDIRTPECAKLITELVPDVVIHTAAQMSVRESMANPINDVDVNVCGLLNILQALPKENFPFFVFLSTGGAIYGEQEQFPCSESHPKQPISVYGASKLASEIYLELWQRVYALDFATLRLANVYGPRQNPHGEAGVVAIFCNALLSGLPVKIYGDGSQTRDYIFVQDVAEAVVKAATSKVNGTFNIGTGVETSVNQLFSTMASVSELKTGANFFPTRTGEQMRSCISPELAERKLHWKAQIQLAAGLRATVAWAKEHLKH